MSSPIMNEIAALKQQNEAFAFAIKSIRHELKNPLATIKLSMNNARNNILDIGRCHDIIQQSGENTNDFLDLMSLESNTNKPSSKTKLTKVNLYNIITDAITFIKTNAPINITFDNRLVNDINANILGDNIMLRHIFINIFKNSIQAILKKGVGGKVTITNDIAEDKISVYIRDNGTGISKSALDKIFSGSYTTKEDGSGTGLAMCKHFMQLMGGDIKCGALLGEYTLIQLNFPACINI